MVDLKSEMCLFWKEGKKLYRYFIGDDVIVTSEGVDHEGIIKNISKNLITLDSGVTVLISKVEDIFLGL